MQNIPFFIPAQTNIFFEVIVVFLFIGVIAFFWNKAFVEGKIRCLKLKSLARRIEFSYSCQGNQSMLTDIKDMLFVYPEGLQCKNVLQGQLGNYVWNVFDTAVPGKKTKFKPGTVLEVQLKKIMPEFIFVPSEMVANIKKGQLKNYAISEKHLSGKYQLYAADDSVIRMFSSQAYDLLANHAEGDFIVFSNGNKIVFYFLQQISSSSIRKIILRWSEILDQE